jgi:N utilization substance protein A
LASSVTGYTIDAVKKTEYEGVQDESLYLDEIEGIAKKYIEVLAKSEIHTSEEFLSTERADILTLKGFGEKTVDKITGIIMEAVESKQANSTKDDDGELEADENEEPILEEVDNG